MRRATAEPERRFLGIEVAGKYFRLAATRAEKRGLANLVLLRGEALYILCTLLPGAFATAVHVYFPDPWPKSRHQKRRLFDRDTVDLVLGLLAEGGRLLFATDSLAYGEAVRALLDGHPALGVETRESPWKGGPRTNYEAKYVRDGRPILRLEARRVGRELLHPAARSQILSAVAAGPDAEPCAAAPRPRRDRPAR